MKSYPIRRCPTWCEMLVHRGPEAIEQHQCHIADLIQDWGYMSVFLEQPNVEWMDEPPMIRMDAFGIFDCAFDTDLVLTPDLAAEIVELLDGVDGQEDLREALAEAVALSRLRPSIGMYLAMTGQH
jgi:hypothetical protein